MWHHEDMPAKKSKKKNPTDPIKLAYEVMEAAIGESLIKNTGDNTATQVESKKERKSD